MAEKYKFLLNQGIGQPSFPIVKEGETVKKGQLIANYKAEDLAVGLHSSVTGKVTSIDEGAIIIEESKCDNEFVKLEEAEPIEMVRNAGILGMGGAGFPAYVKLKTKLDKNGYLIINASECEPILGHNLEQIDKETGKFVKAIQLVLDILKIKKAIIGIKLVHKDVIKNLVDEIKRQKKDFRIQPLKNIYPVGEERALIKACLNTLLEPDKLPSEANSVVFNSETIISIYEAIELKKPCIDKWLTIAGNLKDLDKNEVKISKYPIGKCLSNIIKETGSLNNKAGEIIIGGPYTGHTMRDDEVVEKTTGGIIVSNKIKKIDEPIGIIQCACGPVQKRMEKLADDIAGDLIGYEICKNAVEAGANYKCKDPGNCPGQAEKVLSLYKAGAKHILIGHCYDCTNTVMQAAPKLGIKVHHATDHALEAMGMEKIRYYKE